LSPFHSLLRLSISSSPIEVVFGHPSIPLTTGDSEKRKRELGFIQRLIAGAGAGTSVCAITYPLDLIRVRLTLQSGPNAQYGGIVDAFRQVYRQEGIKGFYLGLWPSMMGIAPYLGLELAVYEGLKKRVARKVEGENKMVANGKLLLCGATAGTAGQIVAYPIDTVRRRMQVQGFGSANYRYGHSILGTMKQIIKAEGFRGLSVHMTRTVDATMSAALCLLLLMVLTAV
jgi:solute carrier family 25 (mitochondrial phosphate transporter), member 23/24/25/41